MCFIHLSDFRQLLKHGQLGWVHLELKRLRLHLKLKIGSFRRIESLNRDTFAGRRVGQPDRRL